MTIAIDMPIEDVPTMPAYRPVRTLRDYQEDCVAKTKASLASKKSSLIVMATGLGKSVCLAKIASDWTQGNVLVLAHRIELVDQLAETLGGELGYMPIVEQGTRGCELETLWQGGLIVVGSVQSMITERRRNKFKDHPFGLVIIDEAHRATSPSYAKLIDHYTELNPQLRTLGVTATPNRTDGTALGLVFDDVPFNFGIVEGIDAGWLVDVHQKFGILSDVDFSQLRTKRNEFGESDFTHEDLEKVLTEEKSLHEMSRPVLDLTEDGKQAIIFTASVPHAHLWAMVLNRYREGCAQAIDGTTNKEERERSVRDYREGRLQFLLNFGIFTEGFDAPSTSIVVMGRPTKSVLVYTQMLGRGTRTLPGVVDGIPTVEGRIDAIASSKKPFLTVLDFVGNSKHKIVSATDVLGGNYDVDIRDGANGRLKSSSGNVREAMRKMKAAMILAAEERKRMGLKFDKIEYRLEDVGHFGPSASSTVSTAKLRGGSTDNQVALLVNLGVSKEEALSYSKKQAGAVISSLGVKRCTTRQANVLAKFGYDSKDFNMDEASATIDAIAANGWKPL